MSRTAPRYFLSDPEFLTDDPAAFTIEARRRKMRHRNNCTATSVLRTATTPRRVGFTSKPFAPEPSQLGAWVRGEDVDGNPVRGQVWAMADGGNVWVVDQAQRAYRCRGAGLTSETIEQPDLLTVMIEAGRLEIVRVAS